MFVLSGPDAVLVLANVGDLLRLDASMATAGGASPGAVVLAHDRILAHCADAECQISQESPRQSSLIRLHHSHLNSNGFAYTHSVA